MALAVGFVLLAGCRSATVYGFAGYRRDGFTVRRLSADHCQVTFAGGNNVGLYEVKQQVRRRAAELTLAAGYSHFVIYTNGAEAEMNSPGADFWNAENGHLSGTVKRAGTSFPSSLPPYQGEGEANLNRRYTASSEIVVLKSDDAARNPDALSAREVLDRMP